LCAPFLSAAKRTAQSASATNGSGGRADAASAQSDRGCGSSAGWTTIGCPHTSTRRTSSWFPRSRKA